MQRTGLLAPLAALALAFGSATTAGATTTITSTFDTGVDGWRFGRHPTTPRAVSYDYHNKAIVMSHGVAGWGFLAPSSYLGDKSAYIGGTFSFELASQFLDYANRPLLTLTAGNGKTIYSNWGPTPGTTLTPFDVTLTAANFYNGTDVTRTGDVSKDEFAAIMADLKAIQVYGDWTSNVDVVRLDNVAMSARSVSAVPEPATWAMMIVGFGAAGAAIRRRREVAAVPC
jgi:hypothetical protein